MAVILFFHLQLFVMSLRRRSHCRFVGSYCVFRSGAFIRFRLFLLPSGLWLHLSGAAAFFSSSIKPPL